MSDDIRRQMVGQGLADEKELRFRKAPQALFESDEERRTALAKFEQTKFTRKDYSDHIYKEMKPIVGDIMACGDDPQYADQIRKHHEYLQFVMYKDEDPAFRAIAKATYALVAVEFALNELQDEYLSFGYIEDIVKQKLDEILIRRSQDGQGKKLFGAIWQLIPEVEDLPMARQAVGALDRLIIRAEKVRMAQERETIKEWTDQMAEQGFAITLSELLEGKDGRCRVRIRRQRIGRAFLRFGTIFWDSVEGTISMSGAFQAAGRPFRRHKLQQIALPLSTLTAEFDSPSRGRDRDREQLVWDFFQASLRTLKSGVTEAESEEEDVDGGSVSEAIEASTVNENPQATPTQEPQESEPVPVADETAIEKPHKCPYEGCPDSFETKPKRNGHMARCGYKKEA